MSLNIDRFPARAESTVHRLLADEAIIVNFKNSFFYNVSPVGTFIWERCDGQHSLAQIAAELVKEYDVAPEVAVNDCEQFVQELVQEGILEWKPSPAESD